MQLTVHAIVARNEDLLTEVDFSSARWKEWQMKFVAEGIDVLDLLPSMIGRFEIDSQLCVYKIGIDARCVCNMWKRASTSLEWVPDTGGWITDEVIPPHDWMCPGDDSLYWFWGAKIPYVVGIHPSQLETP